MAGATPLSPFIGGLAEVVVVLVADMSGGLRGKVPVRDTVVLSEAMMVSMDREGSGWTGELGLWIVWKLPAEAVDDLDSDEESIGVR
jgi:hypothetical protein